MPFRDQPALDYAGDVQRTGHMFDGGLREVAVPFLDGTLRSCRVVKWRQNGDRWQYLLRWGVSGQLYEDWYMHDHKRVHRL